MMKGDRVLPNMSRLEEGRTLPAAARNRFGTVRKLYKPPGKDEITYGVEFKGGVLLYFTRDQLRPVSSPPTT